LSESIVFLAAARSKVDFVSAAVFVPDSLAVLLQAIKRHVIEKNPSAVSSCFINFFLGDNISWKVRLS
jgi:hypothetical protein